MIYRPFVTIIIPYKHGIEYLFQALKSVFKQTYKNYKIIIIYDNVSKIDLKKINKFIKFNNKKNLFSIKVENNKKNLGAGYSRNIGIKKTSTKYIAFLDSDDLWKNNKLKTQIAFMEKKKLMFSHTSYLIINEYNTQISSRLAKKKITFDRLLKSCDIGLSTVMINTKFLKKNKFYFPKISTKEDYVLWLKIIQKTKVLFGINKNLSYYRKTKNSLSSNKYTSLVNGYKVYRNYMKFNKVKSILLLLNLSLNYIKKNLINNRSCL